MSDPRPCGVLRTSMTSGSTIAFFPAEQASNIKSKKYTEKHLTVDFDLVANIVLIGILGDASEDVCPHI